MYRPSSKTKQQLPPLMSGINNIQDQTQQQQQQPQSPLPPFANGRASTPKFVTTNQNNNNRILASTPSPASSKSKLIHQQVSPSPSSKTRQSFNQKIEEARMLASPSRIDRELKVEVNFVPTTTKQQKNQQESLLNAEIKPTNSEDNNQIQIPTAIISSPSSLLAAKYSAFDMEADKERKTTQEEIRQN